MVGNLVSMLLGLAAYSKEKTEEIAAVLMEKSEFQREEVRKLAEALIERGEIERNAYISRMVENIDSLKNKVVSKQEIDVLEKKLDYLNRNYQNE